MAEPVTLAALMVPEPLTGSWKLHPVLVVHLQRIGVTENAFVAERRRVRNGEVNN